MATLTNISSTNNNTNLQNSKDLQNIACNKNNDKSNPINTEIVGYGNLPKDTVSFGNTQEYENKQNKKSGLSKTQKFIVGAGLLASAIVGGIFIKGRLNNKELVKLAENIKFEPAKNIEDAKAFAKTHLGIEKFDVDNLDVANWVNEGLVFVNNKRLGKAIMPKKVAYENFDEKAMAAMNSNGTLTINKANIGDIDNLLNKSIEAMPFIRRFENGTVKISKNLQTPQLQNLLNRFCKSKDLSFCEKVELYQNIASIKDMIVLIGTKPSLTLKQLFNDKEISEQIKKAGLKYKGKPLELEEILKQNKEEQDAILTEIATSLNIKFTRKSNKFDIIVHEMGHSEHQRNCKNFQNLSKSEEQIKIGKEVSEETKEFLENENIQQTALKVSPYSTESPAEFVAETYKDLINGKTHTEDVMELYRKYEGPPV